MNDLRKVNNLIVGRVTFPFTNYLFNRTKIISTYKGLLRSQWLDEEYLREIQLKKLVQMVDYANKWIPFYRSKFKELGFTSHDIKSLESLKEIPPLTREDVINHHKDMVDERLQTSIPFAESSQRGPGQPVPLARFRKHRLVINTSSGSTGTPTTFYEDGSRTALNWVHELRLKQWYGIEPGAREVRMVRLTTVPESKSFKMRKHLWHQYILPGLNLSKEDYAQCYQKILAYQPEVIWGFTSALAGLAEFVTNNNSLPSYNPRLMIGWAAPVYDHEKKLMTEAFNCTVSNIYGSREVGHVAAICPHGSFHINQENFLVESEVQASETGELLVTNLDISPMPFIRYRMGDLGEVSASQCACGRKLQVLKKFLGRTGEVFITKDGQTIAPNFWCRTFMNETLAGAVKRFQVIYTKEKNLCIKLVKNTNYSQKIEELLKEHLRKNFHSETEIEFKYMETIEPQISGKYQMVINEANPEGVRGGAYGNTSY